MNDELRGKCRTCRFFATNEWSTSSGYCGQSDKPVELVSFETFPVRYLDPGCADVIGEDYIWVPTALLAPYFEGGAD